MTRETFEQLKGQSVEFFIRDVYLPDPATLLSELQNGPILTGVVIDLSDDARDERAAFLVVEVKGLDEPCIVAVDRARLPKSEPGQS